MTIQEHERLHRTGTGKTFTGAIIHEKFADIRGEYPMIARLANRLTSWRDRAKKWETAPIKVKFD